MDILTDNVWLVWSHEHGGWWKPSDWGYTPRAEEAGRYSYRDALKRCEGVGTDRHGAPNEVISPSPELIEYMLNADVGPLEAIAWGLRGKVGMDELTNEREVADGWKSDGMAVVELRERNPKPSPAARLEAWRLGSVNRRAYSIITTAGSVKVELSDFTEPVTRLEDEGTELGEVVDALMERLAQ